MRLLVFFDLPMVKEVERKHYQRFRQFLLKDGYNMLQFSVYSRITNGYDDTQTHIRRIRANLPPQGSVRMLEVTEKQFVSMWFLVGEPSFQEKRVTTEQMLLF